MHRPVRGKRAIIQPEARTQCLGGSEIHVLNAPCANVFCQNRCPPRATKLTLRPDIHVGGEVLANQRTKQDVPPFVPGDQRSLAPGMADLKFDGSGEVARVQVLFGEWAGLMKQAAGNRNPVGERPGVEIQELPDQVLIQLDWRTRVAPNGELHSGIKTDWSSEYVENRI